jgi:hypothetical protein
MMKSESVDLAASISLSSQVKIIKGEITQATNILSSAHKNTSATNHSGGTEPDDRLEI